jgi:hypothetical protein
MRPIQRHHDAVPGLAGAVKGQPFRVFNRTNENGGFTRQAIRNFVCGIDCRDNSPVARWYPVPP